jgi:hypothetical protein
LQQQQQQDKDLSLLEQMKARNQAMKEIFWNLFQTYPQVVPDLSFVVDEASTQMPPCTFHQVCTDMDAPQQEETMESSRVIQYLQDCHNDDESIALAMSMSITNNRNDAKSYFCFQKQQQVLSIPNATSSNTDRNTSNTVLDKSLLEALGTIALESVLEV